MTMFYKKQLFLKENLFTFGEFCELLETFHIIKVCLPFLACGDTSCRYRFKILHSKIYLMYLLGKK